MAENKVCPTCAGYGWVYDEAGGDTVICPECSDEPLMEEEHGGEG